MGIYVNPNEALFKRALNSEIYVDKSMMLQIETLEFVVFLLHHLAVAWNKTPAQCYKIVQQYGALNEYIIPCYDCLHTFGAEYLVDDITSLIRERGGSI